jgi:hypothetical protein
MQHHSGQNLAKPGRAWLEIIQRPTQTAFAAAFALDVVLEASVLAQPLVGPVALRGFFEATRAMYDALAFTYESAGERRIYLEWAGRYQGRDVAGITLLSKAENGLITAVVLHHRPLDQVIAFAADLEERLIRD